MNTFRQVLVIAVTFLGYIAANGETVEPVTLKLTGGVTYRFVPIASATGETIYFGETEVTNAMWVQFLAATGNKRNDDVRFDDLGNEGDALTESTVLSEDWGMAGSSRVRDKSLLWKDGKPPEGKLDFPVTFITVKTAYVFSAWLSSLAPPGFTVRLPTREEWVWAAYGTGRTYPWGDMKREVPHSSLYPVKKHPELNTPEGLFNMYRNASEFIHTDSDGYGGRVEAAEVPFITQWMGTDSYGSGDIPRKDYFGYCHISRIRRDCWGFRVVMVPKKQSTNQ